MFMSRLRLRIPMAARAGVYDAHQALWRLFADHAERRRDFVYRDLGDMVFLTVSHRQPVDREGIWHMEWKAYDPALAAGERVYFSLRANAVRKVRQPVAGRDKGRQVRYDVVQDTRKRYEERGEEPPTRLELAQVAGTEWLVARQEALGLALEPQTVVADAYQPRPLDKPRAKAEPRVTLATLDLSGFATVTEPQRLRQALFAGVGSAKAFGCGLLLIRRARGV